MQKAYPIPEDGVHVTKRGHSTPMELLLQFHYLGSTCDPSGFVSMCQRAKSGTDLFLAKGGWGNHEG
jgi:hypothetical protein